MKASQPTGSKQTRHHNKKKGKVMHETLTEIRERKREREEEINFGLENEESRELAPLQGQASVAVHDDHDSEVPTEQEIEANYQEWMERNATERQRLFCHGYGNAEEQE
jgi:hypothetical protein